MNKQHSKTSLLRSSQKWRVHAPESPKKRFKEKYSMTQAERMTKTIDRDRILKGARSKKGITYKSLRFTADLPKEIFWAQSWRWDIVRKLSEMNTPLRILYPATLIQI